MDIQRSEIHGRGTVSNPQNRFERAWFEPDADAFDPDDPAPRTLFLKDTSRTVIASNTSPDVGFTHSINPYRGCEHGCVYCYARPTHEYLGFSAGLDFETRILVKEDAPELLRRELGSPAWEPRTVAISGVTDAYQPIERKLQLTRRCLEVFCEFRNPVGVVTKSRLVTRDADLLAELARHQAAAVFITITTLDRDLAHALEPRATDPLGRLAAISELTQAGVPAGVMVSPVIPGLTDHEIPAILSAAAAAGAQSAGYIPLRLPHAVKDLFEAWLDRHVPDRKEKVLGRIRSIRGGKLNDAHFGSRMTGEGPIAHMIQQVFETARRKAGFGGRLSLSTAAFRRPGGKQRTLFD